jgi:hypothetical protein
MRNISLEECIIPDVNLVDVYICRIPPKKINPYDVAATIDITWSNTNDNSKILKNYINFKNSTEIYEYHYRDLCYSYDLSNDGQRVVRKIFKKDICTDSCYAISFNEEVLPSHMYPCVNEETAKKHIKEIHIE